MTLREHDYVHGRSGREADRLCDQAATLTELLHHDTRYPAGNRVLEIGCGVGAQTAILAKGSPGARIVSVDIARESVEQARSRLRGEGVQFCQADIFSLPFQDASFDHVFVCFVLEHLAEPLRALVAVRRMLRPGGTITVIEGDHGSAYFSPQSAEAEEAIRCLVEVQAAMGGNALIGRELYPLLTGAGFADVAVSPRMVYVDASRPHLVDGFTKKTFAAMVEGVREEALARGLIDEERWERGIRGLYRTCEPDGTFCYTFFKATAA
jgi:SAM-dependent methyltransferase